MVHEEFNYPIVGRSIRLTHERNIRLLSTAVGSQTGSYPSLPSSAVEIGTVFIHRLRLPTYHPSSTPTAAYRPNKKV